MGIRAIAFSVASVAPHAPSVPITLQLDSQTCTAQSVAWDGAVTSHVTVLGVVCSDRIFANGFELSGVAK